MINFTYYVILGIGTIEQTIATGYVGKDEPPTLARRGPGQLDVIRLIE